MKYRCPLIVVNDIQVSRKFYEDVMGQKVKFDFGGDIRFEGDFSIHDKTHYRKLMENDSFSISQRSNSFELYFEEDEIENAFSRIKESGVEIIHELREQPWGQRVARFYDPDGHIIEIGESLESVSVRYYKKGMSVGEITAKTSLPAGFVESAVIAGLKTAVKFRELGPDGNAPMDLLLLADPSEELVKSYLEKGTCYVAEFDERIIAAAIVMGVRSIPFRSIPNYDHGQFRRVHNLGNEQEIDFHRTDPKTVEIMNIAVREDLQNMGIGKRLMIFIVDEIKKGPAQRIEIGTGNPGVVQMLLYQKCGFRIVDIDFDFFRRTHPGGIYENGIECRDMIRMRMDLSD